VKKDAWCDTILDSIKIGYNKIHNGLHDKMMETFTKERINKEETGLYLYHSIKKYGLEKK